MCPLYVAGLIGPGDRKSVEPMASRWAPGDYDQLHHFISSGVWKEALLEEELAIQADKLIGGASAVLVVDDTALPKKGSHSVGVALQYASALGKTANCQTLVSLTLARDEAGDTAGRDRPHPRRLAFGLRRCWRMQAMACPRRSAKGSTRAA
jgi:SRSO17 transposase